MPRGIKTSGGERVLIDLVSQEIEVLQPKSIWVESKGIKRTFPDMTFSEEMIAVYYDGCYWHECPKHYPHARKGSALAKDRATTAHLLELGWRVIRIWEHEDLADAARKVIDAVKAKREEMKPGRVAHMAAHEPRAWCETCERWPHDPWPIGNDGDCLRCWVHIDDHRPAYD